MSSVVAGETPIINLADDLEDGEIDDDEEEEEQQQKQQQQQKPENKLNTLTTGGSVDDIQFVGIERLSDKLPSNHDDDVVFLGLTSESSTAAIANKSKKPRPLEGKYIYIYIKFEDFPLNFA